jgi:putative transposase
MSRRLRLDPNEEAYLHFVTTTVVKFRKVFLSKKYCEILVRYLKFMLKKFSAELKAYVIMPSHIHFIVFLPQGKSISSFMRDFKKLTSAKIRQQMEKEKNLKLLKILKTDSGINAYKLWVDRFDDYIITSEHQYEIRINYIHDNPVRAGLVKEMTDWKYSSARNIYLDDNSVIQIDL